MQQNKKKLIIVIIAAVIVLPIIFNRAKTLIFGLINAKMMNAPVKVETKIIENAKIKPSMNVAGRLEEYMEIKIVSRVDGWVQKQAFHDGDIVQKGQLLYEIEPDTYIMAVRNAEAVLRSAQAKYEHSAVEMKRAAELVKGDYVSRSYYDQAYANYATDKAAVDAAKADLAKKRLDLSYTKIYAPRDGKIGKTQLDVGNYVNAQTGTLAVLVAIDPIYVNFTVKNEDLTIYKTPNSKDGLPDATVEIQLPDGTIYDETGKIDFIDNKIDKDLGTISLRGMFNNKHKKLIPNEFVRVIMTANSETEVTIVPQNAVLESVNSKYVWSIDENGLAKQIDIDVSAPYEDNWIVINGLKPGDKIISSNIQSIRQGVKVKEIELSEEDKAKKEKAREEAIHSNLALKPNRKKQNAQEDNADNE